MSVTGEVDAILNEDVSTVEGNQEAPKSARELAMEAIELDNLRRMEAETGMKLVEEPTDTDKQIEQQLDEKPVEATPKTYHVKIDGVEREVSEEEMVRNYQKNAAADRRLEEASRLLREAEERAQQLAQQMAQQQQEPQDVVPPEELRTKVKTALSKLYDGDEETATDALTELLVKTRGGEQPTPAQPEIDVDALTAQIQQRMEVENAFKQVKTDYPDLIADPNLEMLTALKITQLVQQGTPRAQAMIDAAEDVYKSLGKVPVGRQQAEQQREMNSRLENKQKLDVVRSASSAAALPPVQAEEANPSDVIAEMAARRLGQSMPKRAYG